MYVHLPYSIYRCQFVRLVLDQCFVMLRYEMLQEVSVFIFTKNAPEVEKLPKDQREVLFEMLKKGPTFLAKLRHPKILTLHHTVEESRCDSLLIIYSDCIYVKKLTTHAYSCMAKIVQAFKELKIALFLTRCVFPK